MGIGDVLRYAFARELDHDGDYIGDPRAFVKLKISSKEVQRAVQALGDEIDDMSGAFEHLAKEISAFWLQHLANEVGPGEDDALHAWPAYNEPNDPTKVAYWRRKQAKLGHIRMLEYSGALKASLEVGGPGNIANFRPKSFEIGTDIFYYYYHHSGWSIPNGPNEEDMKRPIIGLTDEETNVLIEDLTEEIFKRVDE